MSHHYECPNCGDQSVQLCFPIWLDANDLEGKKLHDDWPERIDHEASPERDSGKGYCAECDENVLVKQVEDKKDPPQCPVCGEEVTHAEGDVYGICCNMHKSTTSERF